MRAWDAGLRARVIIIMDESDAFFAEFDRLGEAEVERRLTHFAFDNLQCVYAERWLNRKIDERLRAAQLEREMSEEARRQRVRLFVKLATNVTIALMAVLLMVVVVAYRSHFA
jgi:hypothetical protein